jgi:Concanavalin A-like lectin/glucanases superfamily
MWSLSGKRFRREQKGNMQESKEFYSELGANRSVARQFSTLSRPSKTKLRSTKPTIGTLALTFALLVHVQAQSWLTNGLVAHYPLDGNANDASGNGNNGILNASGITDRFGNPNGACNFFDFEYIWIGPSVRPPHITVSAWFNTTATTTHGLNGSSGFPAQAILRDRLYGWSLSVAAQGNTWGQPVGALGVTLYRSDPSGPALVSLWPSGPAYNDGVWHFVAMTYDGLSDSLYIDGVKRASQQFATDEGIFYQQDGGGGLAMGRDGDYLDGYFTGNIDDVRIYNRGLSDTEMLNLYASEIPEPSPLGLGVLGLGVLLGSFRLHRRALAGTLTAASRQG